LAPNSRTSRTRGAALAPGPLPGRPGAAALLARGAQAHPLGLTAAEGLERYLATKYPAQKRFSLEGGDSLIPLLEDLIQSAGAHGVEDLVIGMAHRGRLNVLVNVLGKVPEVLFSEFEASTTSRSSRARAT